METNINMYIDTSAVVDNIYALENLRRKLEFENIEKSFNGLSYLETNSNCQDILKKYFLDINSELAVCKMNLMTLLSKQIDLNRLINDYEELVEKITEDISGTSVGIGETENPTIITKFLLFELLHTGKLSSRVKEQYSTYDKVLYFVNELIHEKITTDVDITHTLEEYKKISCIDDIKNSCVVELYKVAMNLIGDTFNTAPTNIFSVIEILDKYCINLGLLNFIGDEVVELTQDTKYAIDKLMRDIWIKLSLYRKIIATLTTSIIELSKNYFVYCEIQETPTKIEF